MPGGADANMKTAGHKRGFELGLNTLVYIALLLAVLAFLFYFYQNSYYEKGIKPSLDRLFKGFGGI